MVQRVCAAYSTAAAANVRMVMGGARGSREVQAGGARSMGSLYICVKTPARSFVHEGRHWSCMQAWASSIRFRCPAARFMLPTPQRKGGHVWLVYCICYCPSQARACFVWEFVYGRSAAPNRGYWHLCRAVGGGARGPACRAPGSIGGVFALSPSFLIPGKAAFCSLCCQIYPRRSGFCLHLAPFCWYLSQPTLLPLVHPRNDSACSCSVRLIDSYRSFGLHSVLSALLPDASDLAAVVAQTFASIPAPGSCSAA